MWLLVLLPLSKVLSDRYFQSQKCMNCLQRFVTLWIGLFWNQLIIQPFLVIFSILLPGSVNKFWLYISPFFTVLRILFCLVRIIMIIFIMISLGYYHYEYINWIHAQVCNNHLVCHRLHPLCGVAKPGPILGFSLMSRSSLLQVLVVCIQQRSLTLKWNLRTVRMTGNHLVMLLEVLLNLRRKWNCFREHLWFAVVYYFMNIIFSYPEGGWWAISTRDHWNINWLCRLLF